MISADTDEIIAAVAGAQSPPRRDSRPRHALPPHHRVPNRMRRPRLSLRLGWKEYAGSGHARRREVESGSGRSETLEPAIFSPATKAETGHDENITIAQMRKVVGDEFAYTLESMTRAVYTLGEELAREQGIIIADTKFEFGRDKDGRIIPDRRGDDAGLLPLSGRSMPTSPASRRRASTSNRCATISTSNATPAAGTATPRRPTPGERGGRDQQRYLEAYRRVTGTELKI